MPRSLFRSSLTATLAVIVAIGVLVVTPQSAGAAQAPVGLGTATSYAVLAGAAVTNTGPTVVTGDLGVSPGSSVTGFPPGTVIGAIHAADAAAVQAQVDLTTAYNDAAGRTPVTLVPTELGGTTLTPGVYASAAGTLGITGNLTLDAKGDPNAVFIFKAASTLITASASTVTLIGGAQACNIFWQVGSSATLGTSSSFVGTILALTSITVTTGVKVNGRVLARNGAVTLDSDTITRSDCLIPPDRTTATTLTSSAPTAQVGTPVTFTATVTATAGFVPTGTVAFTSDGGNIGSAPLDATGHAGLTVANLPVGTHQIVATYSGSPQLDSSASPPLTQVITSGPIPPTPPPTPTPTPTPPPTPPPTPTPTPTPPPTPPPTPTPTPTSTPTSTPKPPVVPGGAHHAGEEKCEDEGDQERSRNVKEAKARAHEHRKWDRGHHRDDHGRLVDVQTLHTLQGVIGEGGHRGHHRAHRSWSSHHPGHHHARHKIHKFHERPYVHHKGHPKPRAKIAVTG
ncbi:ice-binding family protein [Sphaerisporangium album]|uniref:ice-binding family protein n=1 Tax=Sphaerisporangium album TaxID=509200 RepID=UPI001C691E33|nr:ice-binding family protein [Sphaerisporangium album]